MVGLALGLALGALLLTFGATVAIVDGRSMEPTLNAGDLVVLLRPGLDRLLGSRDYASGDVVALRAPSGRGLMLKRIVAVGPAEVAMVDGALSVDGRLTQTGVIDGYDGHSDLASQALLAGEIFVLGDNRRPLASNDSRSFGPLRADDVRGRLIARLPLAGLFGG